MAENERPGWLQRAVDETTEKVIESAGDILHVPERSRHPALVQRWVANLLGISLDELISSLEESRSPPFGRVGV